MVLDAKRLPTRTFIRAGQANPRMETLFLCAHPPTTIHSTLIIPISSAVLVPSAVQCLPVVGQIGWYEEEEEDSGQQPGKGRASDCEMEFGW